MMKKLKCCVIDDEPLAADLISGYVKSTSSLELVGTYNSVHDAVKTVIEGNIDLVFLDIRMPDVDGLEFASIVPSRTRIIFVSAYEDYALRSYRVNALDYLLKPVSYEEFLSSVAKALEWAEISRKAAIAPQSRELISSEFLIVKSEYKLVQIPIADIIYVEGLKDYVKICIDSHSADATPRRVVTLMSMKALESRLPSPAFMRVHRSFIINTSRIRTVERAQVILRDDIVIPVSAGYRRAFIDFITSLAGKR